MNIRVAGGDKNDTAKNIIRQLPIYPWNEMKEAANISFSSNRYTQSSPFVRLILSRIFASLIATLHFFLSTGKAFSTPSRHVNKSGKKWRARNVAANGRKAKFYFCLFRKINCTEITFHEQKFTLFTSRGIRNVRKYDAFLHVKQ